MASIRMAQYGTKHGHASGKLTSMRNHPEVEVAGVYEPDPDRRKEMEKSTPYHDVHWFDDLEGMLNDPTIVAVASEGRNIESLDQTEAIVHAGKHVWYDKPAGDDWPQWQKVIKTAQEKKLHVQMGYMLRYHDGFRKIASWAHQGLLGHVFSVRANMSTNISPEARKIVGAHQGGIFYDLSGHMLDQVVWLLGRPARVTAFLRNETGVVPGFTDNGLGVFEYADAIAFVDIAAIAPGAARRFEVYGTAGSAILVDPFEPGRHVRLCLAEARDPYRQGEQFIDIEARNRQELYDLELDAFLATIRGEQPPDRSYDHELLVQETILRATGKIEG